MRPREDELIDPEIAEQLEAIDATLAGEPVAPRFAELAELALLVSVVRPEGMRPEFAAELDRRVERRFGRAAAAASDGPRASTGGRSRRWTWSLTPVWGTAAAALAAAVVAVVLVTSGGGAPATSGGTVAGLTRASSSGAGAKETLSPAAKAIAGTARTHNGTGSAKAAPVPTRPAPQVMDVAPTGPHRAPAQTVTRASSAAAPGAAGVGGAPAAAGGLSAPLAAPAPVPNGRKIIQSSILQLGAPPNRIDAVAQGVFNVVGAVNGIVDSSNVSSTGGPGASAQFQLRVPSASLSLALTDLSRLPYARVISRTDNTRDVNSSYLSTQRQIARAQAALTHLRTQLAAATLETQIASLRAQIAGEQATLARVQASLHALNRQVNYSRLEVSIQAASPGGPISPGGGGGFGLHKAARDALRVLEVTAGVALIALAVLVPVGLLAALAWWLSATVQRRRRERALDIA